MEIIGSLFLNIKNLSEGVNVKGLYLVLESITLKTLSLLPLEIIIHFS